MKKEREREYTRKSTEWPVFLDASSVMMRKRREALTISPQCVITERERERASEHIEGSVLPRNGDRVAERILEIDAIVRPLARFRPA